MYLTLSSTKFLEQKGKQVQVRAVKDNKRRVWKQTDKGFLIKTDLKDIRQRVEKGLMWCGIRRHGE